MYTTHINIGRDSPRCSDVIDVKPSTRLWMQMEMVGMEVCVVRVKKR